MVLITGQSSNVFDDDSMDQVNLSEDFNEELSTGGKIEKAFKKF